MKREIKFRAWVKEDSEMKGYFIPHDSHELNYSELIDVHNENGSVVLQQFTGLTDKNGKEIYEGDIVKWQHGDGVGVGDCGKGVSYIGFHSNSSQFGLFEKDQYTHKALCIFQFEPSFLEAIGNIYENPELL